jgi:hypothetical protein
MKKYFYSDGTNNFGPFSIEELKEKEINRETIIWFQELGKWEKAGAIPELTELFTLVPPPIEKSNSNFNKMENSNNQRPPKTWLVESILVTLFCCLPFGIAGIVNASKVESHHYAGDIEGANRASAHAKKWTMISFWIGIAVGVIYFIIIMAGAASGY